MHAGFVSPLDSLKFFRKHKFLLVSAVAPFLLLFAAGLWAAFTYAWSYALGYTVTLQTVVPAFLLEFLLGFLLFFAWVLCFTFLGSPLLNALLSPLFDIIATKAFTHESQSPLPQLKFAGFFRSFIAECTKSILIFTSVLLFFLAPSIIPGGFVFYTLLAPLGLIFSVWLFGWDHIDRTLSLMNMPLRKRLLYGAKHPIACCALGIWMFIPFASMFLSFTFSAAGAIVVARLSKRTANDNFSVSSENATLTKALDLTPQKEQSSTIKN